MNPRDRELDDEIASHMRMAIEERMGRGESRDAAERAARCEFGNVTHVKEVSRETRSGIWMERFVQDVTFGLRSLRRTPAFTIVAVLTLALAIGANSAVFTVVNGVLLKPLPFREPERLYRVSYLPTDLPFELTPGLFDRLYLSFQERARVFEKVVGYQRMQMTLSGAGDATRLDGAHVSTDFFNLLSVEPVKGRGFAAEEQQPGRDRVVILSDRLWRQRFASDPRILGTAIALDGNPYTVVGVAPPRFTFPASADLWTPLAIELSNRNAFVVSVVGRLRRGTTPQQAKSELEAIQKGMPRDPRASDKHPPVATILPLKETLTNKVEKSLLVFSGAVAFVLLIACANVTNLLLMRASTRRHEMSVRVALGASRARITRQLLTESLLIATFGGAAGMMVAFAGVRALVAMAPNGRIPRLEEVHMDAWVLGVTFAASLITGMLFGIVPAMIGSRRQPQEALAQGVRTVLSSHRRLRGMLVSAEIALALVLLTGAGLMIKSFVHMRTVDTGYSAEHVVTMAVDLPRVRYPSADQIYLFHQSVLDRLARIPGVHTVGAASYGPMTGMGIMGDFAVEGQTTLPSGYSVDKPTVSPGYFGAMGIRIISGRDFTPQDRETAPGVVVISESVARKVWPGQEAVGKRISMSNKPGPNDWLTVVGVVNDVAQDGELTRHSTVYLPYLQTKQFFFIDHMTFVVRTDVPVQGVVPSMRAALRAVDPAVPAQTLRSMDESMLANIAEPLFQTRLLTTFSILALLLAIVGTYGVLAYDVAERRREISLRMALGATPRNVMGMVLRRTAWLAGTGASIGVVGSLAVTGVLTKSLFEVKPTDPFTMIAVVVTIVGCALAAGYVPARRATRVGTLLALPRD